MADPGVEGIAVEISILVGDLCVVEHIKEGETGGIHPEGIYQVIRGLMKVATGKGGRPPGFVQGSTAVEVSVRRTVRMCVLPFENRFGRFVVI